MTIHTRMSINLNRECADILRDYMDRHSVTATETIRRAIGVFSLLEEARQDGGQVLIKSPTGTSKVEFLY